MTSVVPPPSVRAISPSHCLTAAARGRRSADRNDARLVDHLQVEHDVAGRLDDLHAVVVAERKHRRGHAARDAAVPRVEVLLGIEDRRLRPGSAQLLRMSADSRLPSAVISGSRPFGGSTMSDVCRCGTVGSVMPAWKRAAEVAGLDGVGVAIAASAAVVDARLEFLFGQERLVRIAGRWRRRAAASATTAARSARAARCRRRRSATCPGCPGRPTPSSARVQPAGVSMKKFASLGCLSAGRAWPAFVRPPRARRRREREGKPER